MPSGLYWKVHCKSGVNSKRLTAKGMESCRIRLNEFGGATWTRTRNLPIMSRML